MHHPTVTNEEMLGRIARFKDLTQPENAVPLMFIDSVLPGHQRMNWAVIGDTASENPNFKPAITAPHRFQIGVFMCPPGSGPAWHTHDYIELFMPLGGTWRFHWGSDPDGAEDGYADLGVFDMISMPPGTWRAFENICCGTSPGSPSCGGCAPRLRPSARPTTSSGRWTAASKRSTRTPAARRHSQASAAPDRLHSLLDAAGPKA